MIWICGFVYVEACFGEWGDMVLGGYRIGVVLKIKLIRSVN